MSSRYGKPMGGSWTTFYRPVRESLKHDPDIHLLNYGPAHLGGRENDVYEMGPLPFIRENPGLFGGGNVSSWEGFAYWALSQRDVRGPEGPEGGWFYQSKVRPNGRLGSATVDFVISVFEGGRDIACRIVTYFHTQVGAEKEGSDLEQVFFLQDQGYDVVDAFGDLMIEDETGEAAKQMMRRVCTKDPTLMPGSMVYIGDFS